MRLQRHLRRHRKQQRCAIGRRILDGTRADAPAGTGFVFDNHCFAQIAMQAIGDQPCDRVRRVPRGKRIDDLERLILRPAGGRQQCERASARQHRAT